MKIWSHLAVICTSLILCSCEEKQESVLNTEPPTLHVYMWADYVKPELVKQFEHENKCRVVIDTFDSNEAMFAKLKAGASGFDVALPSSYMVKVMKEQEMIAQIDRSMIPNMIQITSDVANRVHDKMMTHSVPYAVSHTVLAYRKDRLEKVEPTWSLLVREDVKGRTTLLNDMRETLGSALKALGHSINTRDEQHLEQARDLVIRWKQNSAKFENEGYKTGIDSGEFFLVMGYSGDLFQVVEENDKVGIAIPKEGVTMSCDEFVILRRGQNPFLAHKFINFFLEPKIAAENMQWMGYLCPNKGALDLVARTFLEHPAIQLPDEVKEKVEVIEDLGPDLAKFTKVWDEIKAAH
jgi:spermidine/putrescine transport system substrate-binding protein